MTNNSLHIFEDEKIGKIRVIEIDHKPWWVLADVCRVLEIASPWNVAARLDGDEKGLCLVETPGGNQRMTIVNESGLRKVVMRSNKPAAKPLMRWIDEEMLPAFHKQDVPEPVAAEGMTTLDYKGNNVRMQMIDGEPWWVLADVCDVLEISSPWNVAARLDDDEKNTLHLAEGNRGNPNMTVVNEPGLYDVIMRSDKPEAKEFKRWVTHEVLPSIRKYGGYIKGQESMSNEELLGRALLLVHNQLQDRNKRVAELEEQVKLDAPKVLFSDMIQKSDDNITMQEMAMLLCNDDVDTGRNRLYGTLRNRGVLMANNLPFQRYIDRGIFRVRETYYTDKNGNVHLSRVTLVTPYGQDWLSKRVPKWLE